MKKITFYFTPAPVWKIATEVSEMQRFWGKMRRFGGKMRRFWGKMRRFRVNIYEGSYATEISKLP